MGTDINMSQAEMGKVDEILKKRNIKILCTSFNK